MTVGALAAALRGRVAQRVAYDGFAEAAVLVLLRVDDEDTPLDIARLLFTLRREELRTHAGQISFPGGRRDPEDADLVATALREADEELALPRDRVEVLGVLDDVPTPSGYVITPVVGVVRGTVALTPQASEVAEVMEHTLRDLREPARYRDAGPVEWHGVRYQLHEYHMPGARIWGATARMVHQLLELGGLK